MSVGENLGFSYYALKEISNSQFSKRELALVHSQRELVLSRNFNDLKKICANSCFK